MLVQRILDFINTLEKDEKPISCDIALRESISEQFSKRKVDEELSKDDIEFLLSCYKVRWGEIVDGENDYTRNPSAINLHWIVLARELESIANKSYLKILIPSIINENDLNNLSPLTETVNLFNFYLGYGGTTLYRKIALCEHLKTWDFALSTYRSLTLRKLSSMSVEELARLKLCKATSKQVSVGVDNYTNFWDFLRKKVFTHLSDHGKIPLGLMPHLVELIERYHYLKLNGFPFSLFKKDIKNFFCRLYSYDLADVNALYGAKIEYKDNEEYLLDLFITLHTANAFSELDYAIKVLNKWLFNFNPALQPLNKELDSGSVDLDPSGSKHALHKSQALTLTNCCSLLVSLFTSKFEFSAFAIKHNDSFWDKSNNVFSEANTIMMTLLPLVAENRPDALISAYGEIIKNVIAPAKKDSSWSTWLTRDGSASKWLDLVQQELFSKLNVYWFEPELLFVALMHFNTNNPLVRSRVNAFLDDLIHTSAQDKNDLMKQLRVNILFTELLNDLNVNHRTNLLLLIKLCDLKFAKSTFLSNCVMYINERLSQLSQSVPDSAAIHFFPQVRKIDSGKLFDISEGIKDVSTMVTEYKMQLSALSIEPKLLEKMSTYLLKIGQPILTIIEKEILKSSGRVLDYIGQYS
jgi:hypothetical protein